MFDLTRYTIYVWTWQQVYFLRYFNDFVNDCAWFLIMKASKHTWVHAVLRLCVKQILIKIWVKVEFLRQPLSIWRGRENRLHQSRQKIVTVTVILSLTKLWRCSVEFFDIVKVEFSIVFITERRHLRGRGRS